MLPFSIRYGWAKAAGCACGEFSTRVDQQKEKNVQLAARNAGLDAEVRDLKQGIDAVEERARVELGMIKPGEVFYQVIDKSKLKP